MTFRENFFADYLNTGIIKRSRVTAPCLYIKCRVNLFWYRYTVLNLFIGFTPFKGF